MMMLMIRHRVAMKNWLWWNLNDDASHNVDHFDDYDDADDVGFVDETGHDDADFDD